MLYSFLIYNFHLSLKRVQIIKIIIIWNQIIICLQNKSKHHFNIKYNIDIKSDVKPSIIITIAIFFVETSNNKIRIISAEN